MSEYGVSENTGSAQPNIDNSTDTSSSVLNTQASSDELEALAESYIATIDAQDTIQPPIQDQMSVSQSDAAVLPASEQPLSPASEQLDEDAQMAVAALSNDDSAQEVRDPDPQTLTAGGELLSNNSPSQEIPLSSQLEPQPENFGGDPAGEANVSQQSNSVLPNDITEIFTAIPANVLPSDGYQGTVLLDSTASQAGQVTSLGSSYTDTTQQSDAKQSDVDQIEQAALEHENLNPATTLPFSPAELLKETQRAPAERVSGAARGTGSLAWGSRSDIGCIRSHNEDSFLIRFPLFAVADGMGGHEAGEIASTIAVSTLATTAPASPDHESLGKALESANEAIIQAAGCGLGKPGMGTTCTAAVIDGDRMAIAHVGDSRCYLLHAGQLVRITHDHSFVEELVAAGQITPEEARVHPNRSVITRALGSDPAMRADSFTINVVRGDRILLCTDGLNSMVPDALIEESMVSTPTPQSCADSLVELALSRGGYDNISCIVIDIKDDGTLARAMRLRIRNILLGLCALAGVLLAILLGVYGYAQHTWYLADSNGYVTLNRGLPGDWGILPFNEVIEVTEIESSKLSGAVEARLTQGIMFGSEEEARKVIGSYRNLILADEQAKAAESEKISSARAAASAGEAGA